MLVVAVEQNSMDKILGLALLDTVLLDSTELVFSGLDAVLVDILYNGVLVSGAFVGLFTYCGVSELEYPDDPEDGPVNFLAIVGIGYIWNIYAYIYQTRFTCIFRRSLTRLTLITRCLNRNRCCYLRFITFNFCCWVCKLLFRITINVSIERILITSYRWVYIKIWLAGIYLILTRIQFIKTWVTRWCIRLWVLVNWDKNLGILEFLGFLEFLVDQEGLVFHSRQTFEDFVQKIGLVSLGGQGLNLPGLPGEPGYPAGGVGFG
ncbi:hypothetical protein AGLY_014653 [Aphis glycines]|uniref:Transmembrane protein n=1 Tax=Aphis glycines TaxID=307491 RepID=A0A6G0T1U2_APHGL|nr:hypothetical protein AGLY_014653 [Aphis glycines]